jgi:cellulose synthase/poly-beta-1,6-N-acetylglucosamine synthase-like glycosyltransferase
MRNEDYNWMARSGQVTTQQPPWDAETLADMPAARDEALADTLTMEVIGGPQARRTTALVPAHNEEASIAQTIACLRQQDLRPDRIIVVCDNCTDSTEAVAASCGADTYVTRGNVLMKAGALNQVLEQLVPVSGDDDMIVIVDADTYVTANFTAEASARFTADHLLGGLSGVYGGKHGSGFVGWCQRNEFARWGFDARQQNGKAICLSGAASAFTVGALRMVKTARIAGELSGGSSFYADDNFTEDFELTQALLHCGYRIRNMMNVAITTDIKPTWATLHVQRLRWNRGITETLLAYGLTRHTRMMWAKWCIYLASVISIPLSFFLISYRLASGASWHMNAWLALWLAVTGIISLYKSVTVLRTRGAGSALAAAALVPEIAYDSFLHLTFLRSLAQVIRGSSKSWR